MKKHTIAILGLLLTMGMMDSAHAEFNPFKPKGPDLIGSLTEFSDGVRQHLADEPIASGKIEIDFKSNQILMSLSAPVSRCTPNSDITMRCFGTRAPLLLKAFKITSIDRDECGTVIYNAESESTRPNQSIESIEIVDHGQDFCKIVHTYGFEVTYTTVAPLPSRAPRVSEFFGEISLQQIYYTMGSDPAVTY